MALLAIRSGFVRELVINLGVVVVAVASATAIVMRFFLIETAVERIPLLPLIFAPLGLLAFPLLALSTGFALAQGSASSRGAAPYKLREIYDRMAVDTLERFIGKLPPESVSFLTRVAEYLDSNQEARAASAEGRRAVIEAADELRELARELRDQGNSRGAARCAEMANSVSANVYTRRLLAEIDTAPGSNLQAGRMYNLRLRFEADPVSSKALPAQFGVRKHLNLTLHLFGENLKIDNTAVYVQVPEWGASTPASAQIEIPRPGSCKLTVVVTTSAELEILQTYTYRFDAAEVPTATVYAHGS